MSYVIFTAMHIKKPKYVKKLYSFNGRPGNVKNKESYSGMPKLLSCNNSLILKNIKIIFTLSKFYHETCEKCGL